MANQHTSRPARGRPDTDEISALQQIDHEPLTDHASQVDPKPKSDFSLSQIVGGALAAMAAAAVGSQLGMAGTIIGAALASVVAGVVGAAYNASLRHTQHRVRTVFSGGSVRIPRDRVSVQRSLRTAVPTRTKPRLPWKPVLAAAAGAFVLAAAAITGIELVAGSALSGGGGTTVGQVSRPERPKPADPSEEQSADPPTSTPSQSASAEPTPPDASASAAPTTAPTHPLNTETAPTGSAPPSAEAPAPGPSSTAPTDANPELSEPTATEPTQSDQTQSDPTGTDPTTTQDPDTGAGSG